MMTDAAKDADDGVQVKDIVEIMADNLPEQVEVVIAAD
jgi:hypothetical protein